MELKVRGCPGVIRGRASGVNPGHGVERNEWRTAEIITARKNPGHGVESIGPADGYEYVHRVHGESGSWS